MITITQKIYEDVAQMLVARIDSENFFNGTLEYDTDEFYSSLRCTLIICRDEGGRILSVLPVWWEFHLNLEDGERLTDFDWNELNSYLEKLF